MTKGVKKLRAAEADAGKQIVHDQTEGDEEELDKAYGLDHVPEVSLSRPICRALTKTLTSQIAISAPTPLPGHGEFEVARTHRMSITPSIPSTTMSKRSHGVLDWNRPGSGTAQWERTLWYVISRE